MKERDNGKVLRCFKYVHNNYNYVMSGKNQLKAPLSNQASWVHTNHSPVFSVVWFKMKNTCAEMLGHRILKQTFDTEKKAPMAAGYTVYSSHPRLCPKLSSRSQSEKPPNKQNGRQSKHTPAAGRKSPTYLALPLSSPISCSSKSELPEHPCTPPLPCSSRLWFWGRACFIKYWEGRSRKSISALWPNWF